MLDSSDRYRAMFKKEFRKIKKGDKKRVKLFYIKFSIFFDMGVGEQLQNQKLKDENNRLKGEQGKPVINPQAAKKDISSEKERKTRKKKKKKSKSKKHKIIIDRVVKCTIDKLELPPDAVFKGYQPVVVQDIVIKKDNIAYSGENDHLIRPKRSLPFLFQKLCSYLNSGDRRF